MMLQTVVLLSNLLFVTLIYLYVPYEMLGRHFLMKWSYRTAVLACYNKYAMADSLCAALLVHSFIMRKMVTNLLH